MDDLKQIRLFFFDIYMIRLRYFIHFALLIYTFHAFGSDQSTNVKQSGRLLSKSFFPNETNISSEMRSIGESNDGYLLFSTDRALIQFDGLNWNILEEGADFGDFHVASERELIYSQTSRLWLYKKDDMGRMTKEHITENVSSDEWTTININKILKVKDYTIAFNSLQLMIFDQQRNIDIVDLGNWSSTICKVNDKIVLFGAFENTHVCFFDLETLSLSPAPDAFDNEELTWVEGVAEGQDGNVWIGGRSGRIFFMDSEGVHSWYKTHAKMELPSEITAIVEDQKRRIIVSTLSHGIYIFHRDGRLLGRINEFNGLNNNESTHLYVDKQNGLWVAMRGSVQRFDLNQQSLLYDSSLGLKGEVLSLTRFRDKLYVGTGTGLFVMEDDQFPISFRQLQKGVRVSWLGVSHDRLLVINREGFYVYDGDTFTQKLPSGCLFAIIPEHHPDRFFIEDGTRIRAFQWVDGDLIESNQLSYDEGRALGFSEDKNGWIWGVISAGKNMRFRPNGDDFEFESISTEDGLPDSWAQVFVIEGECYLGNENTRKWDESLHSFVDTDEYAYYSGWIPFGYEHLFTFSENNEHWIANGLNVGNLVKRPAVESIGAIVVDGLNFDYRAKTVYRDKDGIVWLGGANSLIRFEEESLSEDQTRPQVVIKSISCLDDKKQLFSGVQESGVLEIDYKQRSIRVSVGVNDYKSMGFIRLAMSLEGAGRETEGWNSTNTWEFTNLSSGSYKLSIEGQISTGELATPAIVNFVIHPPFYATYTAYTIYVILFILLLLVVLKLRTRHLLRLNKNLEMAVSKRTVQVTEQADRLRLQNVELNRAKQESDKFAMEAKKAAESKSRFIANMSHEIRTPMNGVIGMCALLSETPLTSEQREFVTTIENSGHSLLSVINDILHFSKVDSGSMLLETISFNLNDVIGQILSLLSSGATEKGLELVYDVDPDINAQRIGDPVRIQQVLANLIGNAIKFTSQGEVLVRVRASDISKDRVCVEIVDTGIGISEESRDALFKPFSQVDASITRRFGGTGLGLAISMKIVELMDGNIRCESVEGKGSTFQFEVYLPVDQKSPISKDKCFYDKVFWFDFNQSRINSVRKQLEHCHVDYHFSDDITEIHHFDAIPGKIVFVIDSCLVENCSRGTIDGIKRISKEYDIFLMTHPGDNQFLSSNDIQAVEKIFKPLKHSNLVELFKGLRAQHKEPDEVEAMDSSDFSDIEELNVLVVEDNRVNQRLATLSLGHIGVVPDICYDGLESLEAVKQKNYHLIFMDLQMPNMGGFEATREIRKIQKESEFSSLIYALTAGVAEFDGDKCIAEDMNGYISKPVKIQDFKNVISETVKKYQLRASNTQSSSHEDDVDAMDLV